MKHGLGGKSKILSYIVLYTLFLFLTLVNAPTNLVAIIVPIIFAVFLIMFIGGTYAFVKKR